MNKVQFKNSMIASGLCVGLLTTGYVAGRIEDRNDTYTQEEFVDNALIDYSKKRDRLEEEIERLTKQRNELKNSKTFNIGDLIVMECKDASNSETLYILEAQGDGIYKEYHGDFKAWYNLHDYSKDHVLSFCSEYVHFNEGCPLFYYLNDEEIEYVHNNLNTLRAEDLDIILTRIRMVDKENQKSVPNSNKFGME